MNFDKPQGLENINEVEKPKIEEGADLELEALKNHNEKDLEKYEQIIPEHPYPSISESIYILKDLTSTYWKEEDFVKKEAKEYFLSNPISENFTISKIKFELKENKYFGEFICNSWDIMDDNKYSFIQKQVLESFFKENFLTGDYNIESYNFDLNTYESTGLDHASFFNKSLCLEALDSNDVHVKKILEDLKDKSDNFKNNPYNYPYLVDYFIKTDETFKEKLTLELKDCFDNSDFSKLPKWRLLGQSKEMSLVFKEQLSKFLAKYGLNDSETFFNSWIEADYQNDGSCIEKNMNHVFLLEKQKPGSSKILYENNGVTRFDRMSPEFWLKQIAIGDTPGRFGMFIVSRHDHNNSFESEEAGPKLEKVYDNLEHNNYITRYIEVANKIDLAKKLLKQNIVLGDQNKIEYALVFAHGSPDGIALTQNFDEKSLEEVSSANFKRPKDIKYIDKSDFEGDGFKNAKKFFIDEPTVGFISCSVGAPGGFVQSFSKTYNANSVAADKPIGLKDVSVVFNNDKPEFNIEYRVSENTLKNTFSSGEISRQEKMSPVEEE